MSRIEEIRARLESATPGSWVYDKEFTTDYVIYVDGAKANSSGRISAESVVMADDGWRTIGDADGEFIAHAKEDIRWLLDELSRVSKG